MSNKITDIRKVCCPICNGKGILKSKIKVTDKVTKEKVVKALLSAGLSYRQIMEVTGYKSPRSIHLINKKNEQ